MSHQRAGLGNQSRVLHLHRTYWQLRAILQPGFSLRGTHQPSHTPRMFSNIGMVSRFHWLPISETRNWNRYSSKSNLYPVINYWYIFKLVQLFRLYYQQVSANLSKFDMVETDVTTVQLTGLIPNTQYSLYSTALIVSNDTKIESTPSETLIAWTDPAFPAFVEVGFSDNILSPTLL